ncbi:MAG: terminase, partial [Thermoleophilia bacterium]|nr:terminase [Thermoleophilia bacterium]
LPQIRDWYLGVDYGTTNPFVALLVGVGIDDTLYVAREWRWDSKKKHRQLTDAEYSARLKAWLEDLQGELGTIELRRILVDPSAASFITQLHRDGWSHVRKADNAVSDGIRNVSTLHGADLLKAHKRCEGYLEEKQSYVWDPKAQERGKEEPLKINDHAMDAERYIVRGTRNVWKHFDPALKEVA